MIADVDDTIAAWLADLVPDVTTTLAPPRDQRETHAGPGPVELTVHLAEVREEVEAGTPGWTSLRDERGVVVGRLPPARSYRLTYLLVASGPDPRAEHAVLGRVLAGSLMNEVVRHDLLAGAMAAADLPVTVRCAPPDRAWDARHLWSAWGIAPRASLELSVLAPMPAALVVEVVEPPSRIQLGARGWPASPGSEGSGPAGRRPSRPRPTAVIEEG